MNNNYGYYFADNIIFYVDGELISKTLNNPRDTVRSVAEVSPNAEYIWRSGTKLAPFDQEVSPRDAIYVSVFE